MVEKATQVKWDQHSHFSLSPSLRGHGRAHCRKGFYRENRGSESWVGPQRGSLSSRVSRERMDRQRALESFNQENKPRKPEGREPRQHPHQRACSQAQ